MRVRTLVRIGYVLCVVGIGLGVLGLLDAYRKVGFSTREGHIISVAVAVALSATTATVLYVRRTTHQPKRKGRNRRQQHRHDEWLRNL